MKTLVWDVDDVLNDLMRAWFEQGWRAEHVGCAIGYADLRTNPPHEVLGVTRRSYLDSLDRFRQSEAGDALTPNAELLAWFEAHGAKFRHIALTARPLETAPSAAAWVMRHFGRWIRVFAVVPSRPPVNAPEYDRDKGKLLRWLGRGDALIDDSETNLAQARAVGLTAFAWPQPWNEVRETKTELLERLLCWAEEESCRSLII
jgi:hypothetical protein